MYYHPYLKKKRRNRESEMLCTRSKTKIPLHKVRNYLNQKQDQDYNRELQEAKLSTRAGGTVSLSQEILSHDTKVQVPTPRRSIQNQKDKCKTAHFIMQTFLIHTLTFHISANYAMVCSKHSVTYFSCKFLTPKEC